MPFGRVHNEEVSKRTQVGTRRGRVHRIRDFLAADKGATMVEHALLVALLSMLIALTLWNIGNSVRTRFSSVSSCLTASSTC
jgi:Flp pilus assembly pilin Flp